MITSNNLLRAELKQVGVAITEADQAVQHSFAAVHAFSDSLERLRKDHRTATALTDLKPREKEFLDEIGEQLAGYTSEFVRHQIPHRRLSGAVIVDVKLNHLVTGAFLLDTGASVTTLSPEIAARLRLQSHGKTIEMIVADGSRVTAQPVTLQTVAVGEAVVENVPAVIMPDAPGKGLDGLLGMTFLREFEIRVDPASGTVTLHELR